MLKGMTLNQLAARITAEKELKRDMIADTSAMEMAIDDEMVPALAISGEGTYPLLPLAHDQIGSRLGIPSKYYDRMLRSDPHLLSTNVNAWFWNNPEKRMVRTLGGDARAFLSNRYNRIDHAEIAEVALPVLAAIPDVEIVSCEITHLRMYIQATTPRIQGEVKRGDVVQAGVIISNSEVGAGAVSVSSMFKRLMCLNGMVSLEKFRAFHVGRQVEDSEELWRDDTRQADDRAILLKVRDMVSAAVDQVRFSEALAKMQGLARIKVTGDVGKAVEVLAQKVGTTETERDGILRALIEGADLSAWGLLNAVTVQAHTAANYDRCVELEAAGGMLLDMGRDEWRKVLEAA